MIDQSNIDIFFLSFIFEVSYVLSHVLSGSVGVASRDYSHLWLVRSCDYARPLIVYIDNSSYNNISKLSTEC